MTMILVVNAAVAGSTVLAMRGQWVAAGAVLALGLLYGWYQTTHTAARRWAERQTRRAAR